jgi:MFS family permease
MFHAKDRGKSLAIAGLLPYLGMALGPIIGGLAVQQLHWPWLFWILSFLDGICLLLGFFFLHETHGPALGLGVIKTKGSEDTKLMNRLIPSLTRPFRYLFLRPVVSLCALVEAVDFGTYTLILSIYASLWIDHYGQSQTVASLHYISISVGTILGAQLGGPLMDFIWRRMKASRGDGPAVPEFRVPHMLICGIPGTSCLFLFAWAGHLRWHWIVVDIGVAIFAGANFMFSQGILAYMVDEFGSQRAASAGAAMRAPAYVLGFAFPIFAPNLEAKLGYGLGISILGAILLALMITAVSVLWFFGDKFRAMGKKDKTVNVEQID